MRWSSTSWLMSPALTASLANAKMSGSEWYSCKAILETLLLVYILRTLVLDCATQVALFGHVDRKWWLVHGMYSDWICKHKQTNIQTWQM